jgi:hypothetical protein
MVVEAVSRGIVSGKFPENGKSTGNFANLMVALPPYPILTFYFYCHFQGNIREHLPAGTKLLSG